MRNRFIIVALNLISLFARSQQVPKTVIAEHFTNTYCSICASRNPGLFSNLNSFPQVIHLAYYPSAPYASCPLSMHNPGENNARTMFYGVYGSTPQLVVGGSVITSSFTDPAIFSSQLSATSSFAMKTLIEKTGSDSITVKVIVKKVDTSSFTSLQLFACVAEDTLSFIAHNGETANYDVFRKALWGTTPLTITPPGSVGDSSIYMKAVPINSVWNLSRVYSVSIMQRADKGVVQASRSLNLQVPAAVAGISQKVAEPVYPNPASDKLFFDRRPSFTSAHIIDNNGVEVKGISKPGDNFIEISTLSTGIYLLILNEGGQLRTEKFIKK